MSSVKRVAFEDLANADLYLDALCEGGAKGTAGDDPLARLLPCGNQGGFRFKKLLDGRYAFVVLYTDLGDVDWPDALDVDLARFTYYGDNKRPGHDLHDTKRGGNRILRDAFAALHASPPERDRIPPFLVFSKAHAGRDVVFRGLAVPGAPELSAAEDLVAIWRTSQGQRFQNYRAVMSILDSGPVLPRSWITSLLAGDPCGAGAPSAWLNWRETGVYARLIATPTRVFRTRTEQEPQTAADAAMIETIHTHFANAHDFEPCAARIWSMYAPESDYSITRPSRDGGRDAVGYFRLGPSSDPIKLEFALEAKRYAPGHGVGVRDVSRLISRLRHRQFGVFVTTSFVLPQAYEELREDQHPVVVLAARDIVEILKKHGFGDAAAVKTWLDAEFPASPASA